jgi:hypothetical protein
MALGNLRNRRAVNADRTNNGKLLVKAPTSPTLWAQYFSAHQNPR